MKKLLLPIFAILLTFSSWAQSPEKLSYQAVIRNAEGELVTNQTVGMQISILSESQYGASVYVETQTPTTNANGLISIEIGDEAATVLYGTFATIDWAANKYFIKTETDPDGGTNYNIEGFSQLLSVPYALHAKTAETVTGGVNETDPTYTASQAANITATHIAVLDNTSGTNSGDQDLSALATKVALADSTETLRALVSSISGTGGSESDPVYSSSQAANITASDITNLGNLSGINSGDQDLTSYAEKTTVLTLDNTTAFTPDADYEPATKKYVDGLVDSTYEIGDAAFGGIIFWVDETGKHGLVCTDSDVSNAIAWSDSSHVSLAVGNGMFAGESNTVIATAVAAMCGEDGSNNASAVCIAHTVTDGSTIYADWYLPSLKEVQLIISAKDEIGEAGGTLSTDSYWSSTEFNESMAKSVMLSDGSITNANKANTHGVRAVRAF